MSENPDVIRADIEATRARLGTNVDAVADKVTPSHIVQRQTDKVRDAVFGAKEKVMGAADHTAGNVHSATGTAGAHLGDAGAAIGDAPAQVKAKTQGNPLAAGLIAFGAGLLVSSLLPASRVEQQAAENIKDTAQPLVDDLTDTAKEVAGNLKEPAQQAMEEVKSTAADAAATVKDDATSAVDDVKTQAQDSKDTVQQAAR
jgi:hypothetical protein